MKTDYSIELLPGGTRLRTSPEHPVGTDALVLGDFARPRRGDLVCDLGAGCGILGVLLLEGEAPPRRVDALELQPAAVALMEGTAADNGLEGRLCPIRGDLRDPGVLPREAYDLVVCNPPYFPAGTGAAAPGEARRTARHEGAESCTLEEACAAAARLLRYGGRGAFCHRPERLCDLLEALRRAGLEPKRLRMVQGRWDTAPWLVLAEGKKGGAPGLEMLPPLVLSPPEAT